MKIAIDVGALCNTQQKFGNYTFTKNLIEAVKKNNKKNTYYLYAFKRNIGENELINKKIIYKHLLPKMGWMKIRVSLEEVRHEKDIFLALNQSTPWFSSAKIISFSHGLSFYYYPEFYPDSYISLYSQTSEIIKKSKCIIVSSIKVQKEFKKIYPEYKKIKVIPFGVPYDFISLGVATTTPPRCNSKKEYFMFVGMNHPIKNIDFLIKVFQRFVSEKNYQDYKLCLVGNFEKKSLPKNIKVILQPSRKKLKTLYQNAKGLLTASLYESFNLPVLEALSQNCPVIGLKSAIIPEMKMYVNITSNAEGFIRFMKKAANSELKENDLQEIRNQFSWDRYYRELVKLY